MRSRAALAVASVLLLGGCSQIDGLAPVSGGPITTLRTAANDVLLQNGVEILVAPECVEAGDDFTCAGTTIDGQAIAVTGTGGEPQTMTVTVGSELLYQGDVRTIIEQFGEVPQ